MYSIRDIHTQTRIIKKMSESAYVPDSEVLCARKNREIAQTKYKSKSLLLTLGNLVFYVLLKSN